MKTTLLSIIFALTVSAGIGCHQERPKSIIHNECDDAPLFLQNFGESLGLENYRGGTTTFWFGNNLSLYVYFTKLNCGVKQVDSVKIYIKKSQLHWLNDSTAIVTKRP